MPRDEQTGEANPYALLSKNFEKEFYDRDINLFNKEKREISLTSKGDLEFANGNDSNYVGSPKSIAAGSTCHLSNFTYDKLNQPYRPLNLSDVTNQG